MYIVLMKKKTTPARPRTADPCELTAVLMKTTSAPRASEVSEETRARMR